MGGCVYAWALQAGCMRERGEVVCGRRWHGLVGSCDDRAPCRTCGVQSPGVNSSWSWPCAASLPLLTLSRSPLPSRADGEPLAGTPLAGRCSCLQAGRLLLPARSACCTSVITSRPRSAASLACLTKLAHLQLVGSRQRFIASGGAVAAESIAPGVGDLPGEGMVYIQCAFCVTSRSELAA